MPQSYEKAFQQILTYEVGAFVTLDADVKNICSWLYNYGQETQIQGDRAIREFAKVKDESDSACKHFEQLSVIFDNMYRLVIEEIYPTVKSVRDYDEGKITKRGLAGTFQTTSFIKALSKLADLSHGHSTKN